MSRGRNAVTALVDLSPWLSPAARAELDRLGLEDARPGASRPGVDPVSGRASVPRRAIHAPAALNEAYDYDVPSSFSRGVRIEMPGATMLLLSGTASVDEAGRTVYEGDFVAQCVRTFRNLTALLAAEEASWHDVVRTTCYLRDIDRDYAAFNAVRTALFHALALDPLPASTGIEARLCRPDLLIEIEAIAILPRA